MKRFVVTLTCAAIIRETWHVEARDEAHARSHFDGGDDEAGGTHAIHICDETVGEEEGREIECVLPLGAGETFGKGIIKLTPETQSGR